MAAAADEAIDLVRSAMHNDGGFEAAEAEAYHGGKGGLRFVLDAMADHYKNEQKLHRVQRVLKEAINPLDDQDRIAFMDALFERLVPLLPEDVRDRGASRFVEHYETLVRHYVRSMDRVREVFRSI
jgi:hypothetical protein